MCAYRLRYRRRCRRRAPPPPLSGRHHSAPPPTRGLLAAARGLSGAVFPGALVELLTREADVAADWAFALRPRLF